MGGVTGCHPTTYDSYLLHALALVRIGISRAKMIIRIASNIVVSLCFSGARPDGEDSDDNGGQ